MINKLTLVYRHKKNLLVVALVLLGLLYFYFSSYLSNKKLVEMVQVEISKSLPAGAILVSYTEVIGLTGKIEAKYKLNLGDEPHDVVKSYCQYFLDQKRWYESTLFSMDCNDLAGSSKSNYKVDFCYSRHAAIRIASGQLMDSSYDLIIYFFSRSTSSVGDC